MRQTVAVFEQGGFIASDVQEYLSWNKLPNVPVGAVFVNGYNGTGYPSIVELEAVLDIDMAIGINPNLKEVLVYEDGNDPFDVALIASFEQVAADNLASVLSVSYGADEVEEGTAAMQAENTALTQLAAQGITVLASAGDDGAYGDTGLNSSPATLNVADPGSQPLVISVGGTTLFTGAGESYLGEEVWNDLGLGDGATGGGVSSYWPIPSWQQPIEVTGNGGSSSFRNVPDISAVGDPLTGVAVYSQMNGGWLQIGGTSVSAPIWAGYMSILNSASIYFDLGQLGFFSPTLYSDRIDAVQDLYDILDGSNGNAELFGTPGYNAGRFYDNCSGNGSLWGGAFALDALTSTETGGTPPAPLTGLTIKQNGASLELSWNASGGATGYVIGLRNQVPGQSHLNVQFHATKGTTTKINGVAANTPTL